LASGRTFSHNSSNQQLKLSPSSLAANTVIASLSPPPKPDLCFLHIQELQMIKSILLIQSSYHTLSSGNCRLTRTDFPSLAAFLQSLQEETGSNIAPPQYRQFFSELARCSPAYGIFQEREEQCVFDILKRVLSGEEDIFNSTYHTDLKNTTNTHPHCREVS